jgi:hypothetical protein
MIDPEEVCSQITDPKGCQSDSEVYCGWIAPTSVTLDGATCIRDEGEGSCLAVAGPGDTDGCAPTPGCGGQAYFREVDAEIRVVVLCGAAPPVGYEPCTYMEPGVYEPAECGCLCDETDSTSTGPGDESSGSGSSSGTSG